MRTTIILLSLVFLSLNTPAQRILDRISLKAGYSMSVTQWGISPFSEIRRWDRTVNAAFFNMQYSQPITAKSEINIGGQVIEKGFITQIYHVFPNSTTDIEYQDRLTYVEVPLNYVYNFSRLGAVLGVVGSYLMEFNFRREQIQDSKSGGVRTLYYTNYSYTQDWDRYNVWDWGVNIGLKYRLINSLDVEATMQKHFVQVDNWNQRDLVYNLSVLLGVRYRFLASNIP